MPRRLARSATAAICRLARPLTRRVLDSEGINPFAFFIVLDYTTRKIQVGVPMRERFWAFRSERSSIARFDRDVSEAGITEQALLAGLVIREGGRAEDSTTLHY